MHRIVFTGLPPVRSWRFVRWAARKSIGGLMAISSIAGLLDKPQNPTAWIAWVFDHPPAISGESLFRFAILIVGLLLLTGDPRPRVARFLRRGESAAQGVVVPPATFHAQSVRATIAEVKLAGLVTDAEADEAIEIVFNIDNYSGFPVRIDSLTGYMTIFGDRKRPNPVANLPLDLPPVGPRPLELTQETPGLRGVMFQKGMMGGVIMPFNLGNLKLKYVATMPDGTKQEGDCVLAESHFLIRGPLDVRDPADFAAMQRVSLTYGSNRRYGADGRNDEG